MSPCGAGATTTSSRCLWGSGSGDVLQGGLDTFLALAGTPTQPDALGLYRIDYRSFAVTELVQAATRTPAWAPGATPDGPLDSATLDLAWNGPYQWGTAADRLVYNRVMSDGGITTFVGRFAAEDARRDGCLPGERRREPIEPVWLRPSGPLAGHPVSLPGATTTRARPATGCSSGMGARDGSSVWVAAAGSRGRCHDPRWASSAVLGAAEPGRDCDRAARGGLARAGGRGRRIGGVRGADGPDRRRGRLLARRGLDVLAESRMPISMPSCGSRRATEVQSVWWPPTSSTGASTRRLHRRQPARAAAGPGFGLVRRPGRTGPHQLHRGARVRHGDRRRRLARHRLRTQRAGRKRSPRPL